MFWILAEAIFYEVTFKQQIHIQKLYTKNYSLHRCPETYTPDNISNPAVWMDLKMSYSYIPEGERSFKLEFIILGLLKHTSKIRTMQLMDKDSKLQPSLL